MYNSHRWVSDGFSYRNISHAAHTGLVWFIDETILDFDDDWIKFDFIITRLWIMQALGYKSHNECRMQRARSNSIAMMTNYSFLHM